MANVADLPIDSLASLTSHRTDTARVHEALNGCVYSSDYSDLQDGADDALEKGRTFVILPGVYNRTEPLLIKCNLYMYPNAQLVNNETGEDAVTIGESGSVTQFKHITLGRISRNSNIWHSDTPTVGTDVGVRVINTKNCDIAFSRIQNFSIGLSVEGQVSQGSADNLIRGVTLWDNGISLRIRATGSGWSTQNRYQIGKYHLSNALGTGIGGTRLIQNLTTVQGGNNWIDGGNLEGTAAEYKIETHGNGDLFTYLRFEGTDPTILLGATAAGNHFDRGHNLPNIIWESGDGYTPAKNLVTYIDASDGTRVDVSK